MNKKELKEMANFLDSMIDFPNPDKKSDEEITKWATEKWDTLLEREYWRDERSTPYIQLFSRYMRPWIGDKFKSGKSD